MLPTTKSKEINKKPCGMGTTELKKNGGNSSKRTCAKFFNTSFATNLATAASSQGENKSSEQANHMTSSNRMEPYSMPHDMHTAATDLHTAHTSVYSYLRKAINAEFIITIYSCHWYFVAINMFELI